MDNTTQPQPQPPTQSTISLTKKYKTSSNLPVTILTTTAPGKFPVVGYTTYDNEVSPEKWTSQGKFVSNEECHYYDLVEIVPPSPFVLSVIRFLKSSSYIPYGHKALAIEIQTEILTVQMGTTTFELLVAALDAEYPNWKDYLDD